MSPPPGRPSPGRWRFFFLLAALPFSVSFAPAAECPLPGPPAGVATDAELTPFAYDAAVPLQFEETEARIEEGVRISRFSFASPRGGRATGHLLVPEGRKGPLAGLLMQHGLPGSSRDLLRAAPRYALRGAVVLALDAPFARRAGGPVLFTPQDAEEQIQLIVDLRRAVDYLISRPDVDPARLAYRGWSYGAAMGGLMAGVERRIKTYLLAVGDGGLVSHFTGPEDAGGPLASLPCEARQAWLAAMTPIEPIRFIGRAAPATLFLQAGRADSLVPPADAERQQAAASQPRTIRWYEAGHGLTPEAIDHQLEWLRREVGMD